jgi:hypothetical protein
MASELARRAVDRLVALTRAALCLGVILLVAAWFGARSARADLGEAAMGVGRQLAGFEDLTGQSYRVLLNGEPIQVSTTLVALPISDVLSRFERHCQSRSVSRELEQLSATLEAPVMGEVDTSGIMRRESRKEGLVACLAARDSEHSLSQRLQRFAETLDLADVGLLRYAYARATPSGKTHVVVAWTDRAFRLESLVTAKPGDDAPGNDVVGGARPTESVRLLTAAVEGAPYSARVYDSRASAERVLAGLDTDMEKKGWRRLLGKAGDPPDTRAWNREGRDVLAFAYPSENGSVISMVESSAK